MVRDVYSHGRVLLFCKYVDKSYDTAMRAGFYRRVPTVDQPQPAEAVLFNISVFSNTAWVYTFSSLRDTISLSSVR